MEFHQLRYFMAVADMGNFTRAAEHCSVSQPSLSQQIAKLEGELGKSLFERLGRKVQLTAAGKAFYGRAAAVLAAVDEARASVEHDADWRASPVTVAAIPTVAPYLLPPLLKSFRKQFPKAPLTVRENFTAEIVKDCLAGDADIGILALPLDEERLSIEPLFSEELLLATPKGHHLTTKKTVTLDDLSAEPFVLLSEIHCLGEHIVAYCRQHECSPEITCQTAQLLTVQEMVGLKQGVSLIPEMAARRDSSKTRSYRSLSKNKPKRTIAMIWHERRFQSQLVKEFIQAIRSFSTRGA
jgi:LysR family hydrogen peroxide-inducible transcriptional activator